MNEEVKISNWTLFPLLPWLPSRGCSPGAAILHITTRPPLASPGVLARLHVSSQLHSFFRSDLGRRSQELKLVIYLVSTNSCIIFFKVKVANWEWRIRLRVSHVYGFLSTISVKLQPISGVVQDLLQTKLGTRLVCGLSLCVCVTSSLSMGKEIIHFRFWGDLPISETFPLSPSKYNSIFPSFVLFLVWKTMFLYPKRPTKILGWTNGRITLLPM